MNYRFVSPLAFRLPNATAFVLAFAVNACTDDDSSNRGTSDASDGQVSTATGGGTATGGNGPAGGSGGIGAGGGSGGIVATGGTAAGGSGNVTGGGGSPDTPDTSMPLVGCRAPTPNAVSGNTCANTPPPALALTQVMDGFDIPTHVTHAPGDSTRLFVVERGGLIRIIKDGAIEAQPFLDLTQEVVAGGPAGEEGLLGLAFDPNYQQSGRFWVNYSGPTGMGDTYVVEYRGTPGQPADPSSATPLLQVTQSSLIGNHKGGMLAFGPDGCLFIGMGDGGDGNDPNGHGQNAGDALGNMLRVDVDAYPTPAPGNMTGAGVDPHSWDYGLRNPWRFSFDRVTGDLYIGDVGQDAWEEVDVEPAGVGHRNYGWAVMEGAHCRGGGTSCDMSGKTLPVAEQPNGPNAAVIGGYVYRGGAIPGLVGRYLYGDYSTRTIWSFTWAGETNGTGMICDEYELTDLVPPANITSFGEDAAGEIYVATYAGVIYRIDPG